MAIITLKALKQLLYELRQQHQQRLPRYATPDGLPAPQPQAVPGWAQEWIELKTKEKEAKFDRVRPEMKEQMMEGLGINFRVLLR